jgi:hypothetical protein
MPVTTKIVWGAGFNAAKHTQWKQIKTAFVQQSIASEKTDGVEIAAEGVEWGGKRVWVDTTAAEAWKTFVEESAATIGATVTVTIE